MSLRSGSISMTLVTAAALNAATLTVSLTPSVHSPQSVGTTIQFTAAATGGSGSYDYRFLLRRGVSGDFRLRQDSNTANTWSWTPSLKEGVYSVRVLARDLANKTSQGSATMDFTIGPAITTGKQSVKNTNNSMVALFSAPPCSAGNLMRVVFYQAGTATGKSATNDQKCDGVTTMNFLVAGMYANTVYNMFWQTRDGSGATIAVGDTVQYTNGSLPAGMVFPSTVMTATGSPSNTPPADNPPSPLVIAGFTSTNGTNYTIAAFDMKGRPVWMLPYLASLFSRTAPGGEILFMQTPPVSGGPNPWAQQIIVADLAGNQIQQTNAAIISEQLVAMGKHPITGFHHEVIKLPTGGFLTLGNAEQMVTNANQCGSTNASPNTCDVLGDIVMVLDPDMKLLWAWDAFQQGTYSTPQGPADLINSPAVLGETCGLNRPGCPPMFNATVANDWMHTNSLQMTADGNILVAVRHQDLVLKINYGGGAGNGHIMWRMGKGGDFSLTTNNTVGAFGDPDFITYPWFSHPHGTAFAFNDTLIQGVQILAVFDNGNTRHDTVDSAAHSRLQLYAVNEAARQMNLNTDIDTGVYAFAVGMIQILPNGNLAADAGAIGDKLGPWSSQEMEASNTVGSVIYRLQMASGAPGLGSFLTYRAFRLPNLYASTTP